MGCLDVAFRRVGVETHELQCGAGVLGQELDQAVGEGGRDELAGTQIERSADAQALRFERLAVHLGEQPALGEVERSTVMVPSFGAAGRTDALLPEPHAPSHDVIAITATTITTTRRLPIQEPPPRSNARRTLPHKVHGREGADHSAGRIDE